MRELNEGLGLSDVDCETCHQAVANTTRRGELPDLFPVLAGYEPPHLMLSPSLPLCTTCWLNGDD